MEDLVQRGIQSNPRLTPALRAKAAGLEMKMKKHMMEQNFSQRPSPLEIRRHHPGVYALLSEEAKQGTPANESVAINKVYISFAVATAEQLLIREQISAEAYNRLYSICREPENPLRKEILNLVKLYFASNDMEAYEKGIVDIISKWVCLFYNE